MSFPNPGQWAIRFSAKGPTGNIEDYALDLFFDADLDGAWYVHLMWFNKAQGTWNREVRQNSRIIVQPPANPPADWAATMCAKVIAFFNALFVTLFKGETAPPPIEQLGNLLLQYRIAIVNGAPQLVK